MSAVYDPMPPTDSRYTSARKQAEPKDKFQEHMTAAQTVAWLLPKAGIPCPELSPEPPHPGQEASDDELKLWQDARQQWLYGAAQSLGAALMKLGHTLQPDGLAEDRHGRRVDPRTGKWTWEAQLNAHFTFPVKLPSDLKHKRELTNPERRYLMRLGESLVAEEPDWSSFADAAFVLAAALRGTQPVVLACS
jgi:hypothetical protein